MSADKRVRLRGVSARNSLLLLRAATLLTIASTIVAFLPFRRAIVFGSVPLGRSAVSIDDCLWAVAAAGRRLPLRTMCIEQGLVVQRLLRSGGIDAVLHYGARHAPAGDKLEAHVWVTVDGRPVIGGAEAEGFVEVAAYPNPAE